MALARNKSIQREENRDPIRINNNIRITPIRVVSEDGEQLGIIPTEHALERARDAGQTSSKLPPTSATGLPNHGLRQIQIRQEQEKELGHSHTKTKEIRLRPKTGQNDIHTKIRQAEKFLEHKDKVQVRCCFAVARMHTSTKAKRSWPW